VRIRSGPFCAGGNQSQARFGSRPGRNERTFELMPGLKMGLSNPAGTGPGTGQSDGNERGLKVVDPDPRGFA
jgi:hypothetical protein